MSNDIEPQNTILDDLRKNGVKLEAKHIKTCAESFMKSSRIMQVHLGRAADEPCPFAFSLHGSGPAYNSIHHAITLPVDLLNDINDRADGRGILSVAFRSGSNNISLSTLLLAGGFEETVHYYQDSPHAQEIGLTPFKPGEFQTYYEPLLEEGLAILCVQEVEARKNVDELLLVLGKRPINTLFDKRLKKYFPDAYNKPLNELAQMDLTILKAKLRLFDASW